MMQTIKKHWAYIVLGVSLLFFIYKQFYKPNINISTKTFKTENGWGYDIFINDSLLIHQSKIPAIQGNKSFANETDAKKIAALVVHKIQTTHKTLTAITIHDLDSLHISK